MSTHEMDTALQYIAYVRKEGRRYLIEFPDAPGCQTFADRDEDIYSNAKEAIEGWIEAHLVEGMDLPHLHRTPNANERRVHITISPKLVLALQFRSMRSARGWSQAEIAKRVGVSQQQIAKLEDPDANPTIETIMKVARAFDMDLLVSFKKIA
ncbi:MAG TPA: type II toxin-antitoxin system HicB family antitoxin [Thermoanaerobaculia bacterium]|nr:type II toxin-antitoxin system HicB family antitoxin [Thermoanaerobaculia bacterium]